MTHPTHHRVASMLASIGLLAFAATDSASAQILASYPLGSSLNEANSTHGPVFLFGNTTGPADGVCVGGVGGPPGGADELYTPTITAFNELDFQIDVDFNLTALSTTGRMPVLVGSRGWRFIGVEVDMSGQVGILHNNSVWLPSTTTVNLGEWNWATIKFDNGNAELLVNGVSVLTANIGPLSTNNDYRFTTSNWSNGGVLNGCVRNIVIANDATIGAPSARAANYGTGCDNLSLTANSLPTLGNAGFALDVFQPTPVIPLASLAFGDAMTDPGIDLTFIGMPTCFAYTNANLGIFGPVTLTAGAASFAVPVPNNPALAGMLVSAQAIGFSPTQLTSSNGTRFYLGM